MLPENQENWRGGYWGRTGTVWKADGQFALLWENLEGDEPAEFSKLSSLASAYYSAAGNAWANLKRCIRGRADPAVFVWVARLVKTTLRARRMCLLARAWLDGESKETRLSADPIRRVAELETLGAVALGMAEKSRLWRADNYRLANHFVGLGQSLAGKCGSAVPTHVQALLTMSLARLCLASNKPEDAKRLACKAGLMLDELVATASLNVKKEFAPHERYLLAQASRIARHVVDVLTEVGDGPGIIRYYADIASRAATAAGAEDQLLKQQFS